MIKLTGRHYKANITPTRREWPTYLDRNACEF